MKLNKEDRIKLEKLLAKYNVQVLGYCNKCKIKWGSLEENIIIDKCETCGEELEQFCRLEDVREVLLRLFWCEGRC